jgi:hypothetical protein
MDTDAEFIKKNMGKLVRVAEKDYVLLSSLNPQDLEDIRNIKDLEKIADIRTEQGITQDEHFLLENDNFLLPEELKQKNEKIFLEQNKGYLLLPSKWSSPTEPDDEHLEYDAKTKTYKNVQVDDSFIAIET